MESKTVMTPNGACGVGSNVWVKVGRDKERGGKVSSITDNGEIWVLQDMTTVPIKVNPDEIRISGVATKHDQKKNRLELIPPTGIEGIGRAMTFGATKYSAHNWANGFDWLRLVGSCMRHLLAWSRGEDKDPESGLSHLDHAGACIVMLIAHESEGLGNDDRRKTNT